MDAALAAALVIVLALIVIATVCGRRRGEGFRTNNRMWPTTYTGYGWYRNPWTLYRRRRPLIPPAWWSGGIRQYPGYAAPLELSLPLQNYYEYLHGYPPSSRMPYNA